MLTGDPPFTGGTGAIREDVLNGRVRPPSAVNPAVTETVDEVVLQAMAREKQDRYESVVLLRRALDCCFEDVVSGDSTGRESTMGTPASSDAESANTGEFHESDLLSQASRRTVLLALGIGGVGIGGATLLTQNRTADTKGDSGETDLSLVQGGTSEEPDESVDYPSHTGTHEITATDNYWAWDISVDRAFVLEYTVRNLLDNSRDFDVLLYNPDTFDTYEAIVTGQEEGIRPDYLTGSRPGTTAEATVTVSLSAGTYYLVIDNTDLSDAGDFGTEETRRVYVEVTTRAQS
jgi:hypothetical protein